MQGRNLQNGFDTLYDDPSISPDTGVGVLPALSKVEEVFNKCVAKLPYISAIMVVLLALIILRDVIGRVFFGYPFEGITDIESLMMNIMGFSAMAYAITCRQSIQIDLFYNMFRPSLRKKVHLFSSVLAFSASGLLSFCCVTASFHHSKTTSIFHIIEWPSVLFTGIILAFCAIAFLFQTIHALRSMLKEKDYLGIALVLLIIALLWALPFIYRMSGYKLDNLTLGCIGFALLMIIMLLRVPLAYTMIFVAFLGLFAILRRPYAAIATLGTIPFSETSNFVFVAFPMFMVMGEMAFVSGLSQDLFDCFNKWMGRLPGGLAVASVGGCAGFGAVCGDSMATCITMSSVALEPMRKNNYSLSLATGALASGGTLGILIPPSIGFIFYSMMTEESVGKLFIAGIIPGILLTTIFISIIIIQVKRNPSLAPMSAKFTLKEKLMSLVGVIPVVILFGVVVGGILKGTFTPGEGGAVGAVMAAVYALARRKTDLKGIFQNIFNSSAMFGKLFILFVGVYAFGAFLSASRLPNLLAETIIALEVNKYVVLSAIILLYIVLGCIMNIIPMMMLTLPSLYPTVEALGFNGIWFGVVTVIVMEMGMITPPVGMNVFTLASLNPEIPMSTIFKGVLPFFFGMLLCVFILILFPGIALYLPGL